MNLWTTRVGPVRTTVDPMLLDVATLARGQVLAAEVRDVLANGVLRLVTARGSIDLSSPVPLPVGTNVLVSSDGAGTLRLTVPAFANASGGTNALPPGASAAAVSVGERSVPPPAATGLSASPPQAAPPATPIAPGTPVFSALAQVLAQQDGLAPLFADLAALATRPPGSVSAPVEATVARVLATRLPAEVPISAEVVRNAMENAGLSLESRLARAMPPAAFEQDVKAALLVLRDVLKREMAARMPSATPAPAPPARERAPPPARGEPPVPMRAVPPSFPPEAEPAQILPGLLERTEAALARITLGQLLSLPPEPPGAGERAEARPGSFRVDVPVAFGSETAIVSLAVEREGRAATAARVEPSWRLWFSLDIDPLGPVTALVTLSGRESGPVGVTLWAEREATHRLLRAALPELSDDLRAADLAVGEVAMRAGMPAARPRRASGALVDTKT